MRLEQCIFNTDRQLFEEIEDQAIIFGEKQIGYGVIPQENIFGIIQNYDPGLGLLLFPIFSEEIYGFLTCYQGRRYLYVNTHLPLVKQIFIAGHELYHLLQNDLNHLANKTCLEQFQEQAASLFSALLLVPRKALEEQLRIRKIGRDLTLLDLLQLMDIFAVSYQTIVLRLYETGFMNKAAAARWLEMGDAEVLEAIKKHGFARRWHERTEEIRYANLKALVMDNRERELITEAKAQKDLDYIAMDPEGIYSISKEVDA